MTVDITRRGTLAALSGMAALQATRAAGQVVKPPANPVVHHFEFQRALRFAKAIFP